MTAAGSNRSDCDSGHQHTHIFPGGPLFSDFIMEFDQILPTFLAIFLGLSAILFDILLQLYRVFFELPRVYFELVLN